MNSSGLYASLYQNNCKALASVAQLVGHHSANQKVSSLTPGQSTCLGCGFSPQLGRVQEATINVSCINVSSFPFSLPSPLSRINKRKNFHCKI